MLFLTLLLFFQISIADQSEFIRNNIAGEMAEIPSGFFCANNTFGELDQAIDARCLNSYFAQISPPPLQLIKCASEGETCNFTGTKTIFYGVPDQATFQGEFTNTVECLNSVFGDPIPGTFKACYYDAEIVTPSTNLNPAFPCVNSPFQLQPNSPAIGAGIEIDGFTCPIPGHPGDGSCLEWFNKPGPDIGACQMIYLSENIEIWLR